MVQEIFIAYRLYVQLRRLLKTIFIIVLSTISVLATSAYAQDASSDYADPLSCQQCHADQVQDWKNSDHDWAMKAASEHSVLGDFSGQMVNLGHQSARFYRKNGLFYIETEGPDGQVADFVVTYTFGYFPLQQYLIALSGGRLQAFTMAWDSRLKSEGGQRWFSLQEERMPHQSPFHWSGRYQNWNGMCADCHTTGFVKGYDSDKDTFDSHWVEDTVGCQSCHGPSQQHVLKAVEGNIQAARQSAWTPSPQQQLDVCGNCHSHYSAVVDDPGLSVPLLDDKLPSVIAPGLYHDDGQVKGEVFTWGSFTQSKMHAAGVICSDCHNPHSTRTWTDGNAVCTRCHNPNPPEQEFPELVSYRKGYDSPTHHHHQSDSKGSLCVNCHMPEHTFMQIDQRRDHAIRIPDPEMASRIGAPNACGQCHSEKTVAQIAADIRRWFPQSEHRSSQDSGVITRLRRGEQDFANLLKLIESTTASDMFKASALFALSAVDGAEVVLDVGLNQPQPLVRAYAAIAYDNSIPVVDVPTAKRRWKSLMPLLDDDHQAVRDSALFTLASIPASVLEPEQQRILSVGLDGLEQRLRAQADLPGRRHNLAALLQKRGQYVAAIKEYQRVLEQDPDQSLSRRNLITLLLDTDQKNDAEGELRSGLERPQLTAMDRGYFALQLALLLATGQSDFSSRAAEVAQYFEQALVAIPDNAHVYYNYSLVLMQQNRFEKADAVLKKGLVLLPDQPDLLYTQFYLHYTQGHRQQAQAIWNRLYRVAPDDSRVKAILKR